LYGGITEEVLLLWGSMTVFTWLTWRFVQRRSGAVKLGLVWLATGGAAWSQQWSLMLRLIW